MEESTSVLSKDTRNLCQENILTWEFPSDVHLPQSRVEFYTNIFLPFVGDSFFESLFFQRKNTPHEPNLWV